MANNDSPPQPSEPPTFEQALGRLEILVQELEEGRIGLADGLARYEEGIKLLRQCYEMLENAERRIEVLSKLGTAGEAITEPFDEAPQSLTEKSDQRSRRRSRKPREAASGEEPASSEDAGPGLF